MRFSIWPGAHRSWDDTLRLVRHAEATGWDGVYFADHFMPDTGPGGPPADGPNLECWSVMAGLAAATQRVRLGTLVSSVTYRHPAVLAKIAAAVDQISGGRLLLGVGAGWQENEHAAYGLALGTPKERLDRFEEAVQVLLGLTREPRTTFAGEHFTVTDAPNQPAPVQSPLPLLIGGSGERRTMKIAARHADEWNAWTTPELMAHKQEVLARHCDAVGRDRGEITVSTQALLYLSTDESWLAKYRDRDPGRPRIIGTPAEVVEIVAAYRDVGVDELILPDFTMSSVALAEDVFDLFMAEVAPHFA
ncbi:MAG TPA: TIGR03560 family F420-dependent LLM class oxidoreductase [Acidimicrobiales bacterium]